MSQPGSSYPYEHFEPFDDKAALRNQIARTRADLGETIEELAARTDVKARAREMVSDVRTRAKDAVRSRARRTGDAARSGASTVRFGLGRASRSPVSIAAGAGAGALAGYGIYELVRRRMRGPRGRGRR
jgi:hypothetical protein